MSSCSHAGVHMISMTRAAVSVMRVQLMFVDVMVQCGSQVVIYPCQPAHARMRSCNATRSAIRKCARTRTRDCMNRCDERVHSGCMNVVPVSSSVCEPFSPTYASQQKKNVNAGGVASTGNTADFSWPSCCEYRRPTCHCQTGKHARHGVPW
jgi:hypothetical protein